MLHIWIQQKLISFPYMKADTVRSCRARARPIDILDRMCVPVKIICLNVSLLLQITLYFASQSKVCQVPGCHWARLFSLGECHVAGLSRLCEWKRMNMGFIHLLKGLPSVQYTKTIQKNPPKRVWNTTFHLRVAIICPGAFFKGLLKFTLPSTSWGTWRYTSNCFSHYCILRNKKMVLGMLDFMGFLLK